ncbi:hypothetical protein HIM_00033 [Hirsutella minnesotensis 3608]|nr:hypothetical protein HIM_00033 [Hirsutella minnesotensis 3608]
MPLIMNAEVDKLNGLAKRACELCQRKDSLMRCSACQAIYYCSKDCQVEDREDHKIPCKVIKKARLLYEHEYETLRDMPGDAFIPDRVFETCVGHFWGIHETRPYMRARYGYVDSLLLSYGTADGPEHVVQTSLDHLLDMLRLCRGDNMGLRQLIPALYVRLGRDQEAYDMIKWYATKGQARDYDWGDMSLPFLDVKGADVMEEPPVRMVDSEFPDVSHTATLLLLKVRILLDLQAMQNADMALSGAVPRELVEMVRDQLVGSIVHARPDVLTAKPEELTTLIAKIKVHIRILHHAVERYNSHFWEVLDKNPDWGVLRRPNGPYGLQSEGEALLNIGYVYAAFYETPGAMAVVRGLRK